MANLFNVQWRINMEVRVRIPAGSYAACVMDNAAAIRSVVIWLIAGALCALAMILIIKISFGSEGLDGYNMLTNFITLSIACGVVGGLFLPSDIRLAFLPFMIGNLLACGLTSFLGGYTIGAMSPLAFTLAGCAVFLALNLCTWAAVRTIARLVKRLV